MARRDEGAYSEEICNRGATKPAARPRRKTARDIFKTGSEGEAVGNWRGCQRGINLYKRNRSSRRFGSETILYDSLAQRLIRSDGTGVRLRHPTALQSVQVQISSHIAVSLFGLGGGGQSSDQQSKGSHRFHEGVREIAGI